MRIAFAALLCLLFTLPAMAQPQNAEPINVTSFPVRLVPHDREVMEIGRLRYLGGLVLRSRDRRFSGISGMRFVGDQLLMVTDRGHWAVLEPRFQGGRLTDVSAAYIWPILTSAGVPSVEDARDAESLTFIGDVAYVGFEREHRIEAFTNPLGNTNPVPEQFRGPEAFADVAFNGGLEGLTTLPGGGLLAIEENPDDDYMDGWIFGGKNDGPLFFQGVAPYHLTDLATLPNGDVVTLERRFSALGGIGARLRLIEGDTIAPLTLLDGEELAEFGSNHTVDNMEGLAIREVDGRIQIFIISDNNQNPLQRTILMAFELR